MRINELVVTNSILAIVAKQGVPAGGGLFVSDLYAKWPETGFRESDLNVGLQALIRSGDLAQGQGEIQSFVRLTEQGYRRLALLPESSNRITVFAKWLHTALGSPRLNCERPVNRFRRRDDGELRAR